jgi:hypothetical protein
LQERRILKPFKESPAETVDQKQNDGIVVA